MLQVIKIFNKNADFLDMTSLNTLIKKTNNFQKHLAILDSKKEETLMLQDIKIMKKKQIFLTSPPLILS